MKFLAKTGGGLGDLAVMVAVFRAIVRSGHTVEVIARDNLSGLIASCDFITAVHAKPPGEYLSQLRMYHELLRREWDVILNLRFGVAFSSLAKLYGHERVRTMREHAIASDSYVLFHMSLLDGVIDDWLDPVETAIPFAPDCIGKAREVAGVKQGESYLTVAPGSGETYKCWPREKFSEVAKKVRDRYGHVLVVGAPHEIDLCQWLANDCGATSLAGKLDLAQTCALVSGAAQHLGNDSGLGHVAAANGTPVLAVGGEKKYRPWRQKMLVGALESITPAMVVAELDGQGSP